MQEWAERFYKSKRWQAARDAAIRRDRYLCVDCLRRGEVTIAEEVHHIIPLTPENINDANISLNLHNLKSLCRECHKLYDPKRAPKRYKVDERGRVEIISPPRS